MILVIFDVLKLLKVTELVFFDEKNHFIVACGIVGDWHRVDIWLINYYDVRALIWFRIKRSVDK